MKIKNIRILILLFSLPTQLVFFAQPALSLNDNSYTYVKSNLEFLASDELEGRETASRGEKLASLFISEELEKNGVKPFGDSGSYFQTFNMQVEGLTEESGITFLFKDNSSISYSNTSDIAYSTNKLPRNKFANNEFEIVFAGYGIISEEDDYDSYKNIDVAGKVVLILNGTPKNNGNEILVANAIRKYRWSSAKTNLAKSKNAVGVIILPDDENLMYWDYIINRSNSKSYSLEEEIERNDEENIPIVYLNENSAKTLLENEKFSFEKKKKNINLKPDTFTLNAKVNFNYKTFTEIKPVRNVIGLIEGNDPALKNEYVTIGAHYDHEGIKGSEIYNGADDNGSGTVTILETARQLSLLKNNKRPILVIFHTGEEKGLKGSTYLANNSSFVDNIISHINIDMVGRQSEDTIYCIGASRISTELGQLVEQVNKETVNFYLNYTFDSPTDPNRFYYRSDHISYANKGIPIAFFYDYMQADYHKPSDTVEKINFTKIVKMVNLLESLVLKISNLEHKLTVNNNILVN
ncbi:MAG: M28 family peptidase [Ignavibacteriales bacterium]|nr:M28 family peptidase [Ignavibacteriales bacterium]